MSSIFPSLSLSIFRPEAIEGQHGYSTLERRTAPENSAPADAREMIPLANSAIYEMEQ